MVKYRRIYKLISLPTILNSVDVYWVIKNQHNLTPAVLRLIYGCSINIHKSELFLTRQYVLRFAFTSHRNDTRNVGCLMLGLNTFQYLFSNTYPIHTFYFYKCTIVCKRFYRNNPHYIP